MTALEPRSTDATAKRPALVITYCRQCNWMLRAAWMAQELLATFSEEIGSVTLVPGTGGIFTLECDGATLWDRTHNGGFPDIKTLKSLVRDAIAPEKALGHIDR